MLPIAEVRRFNRTVTAHVGALEDHFLGRGLALGEARLLWEIGPDGAEVRSLRSRLGLDSGYASRLLRGLERRGLVTVAPDPGDRRRRLVTLTVAGARERDELDRRSDDKAASLLSPLDPGQRERLVTAMREVERLLTAGSLEFREVDVTHPDAQRCLAAYVAELNRRSDIRFDPSQGSTAEPHEMRPPRGVFLVVYRHGEAVGCGGLKHQPGGWSDLKRMWVADEVRGLGVGKRLLVELEARAPGRTRLETSRHLTDAIGLYRRSGYVEVPPFNDEPFAHHWFEKRA
jgi:DNA-binding MarR family transcriptional regulator/GNAT superfamily N-acetyltransferase